MIITKFINELGNKIKIKIKGQKETVINQDKKIKIDMISISIIGPSSTSENIITHKEAEELYAALKNFLNMDDDI